MTTPSNHWKPSPLTAPVHIDPIEAAAAQQSQTLRPFNISRSSVGALDKANSQYQTDAEHMNQMAEFMIDNVQRDYHENRHLQDRTYLVLPGGDTLYHTPQDTAQRQPLPVPDPMRMYADRESAERAAAKMDGKSRVRNQIDRFGHAVAPMPERKGSFGHYGKGQIQNVRNRGGFP